VLLLTALWVGLVVSLAGFYMSTAGFTGHANQHMKLLTVLFVSTGTLLMQSTWVSQVIHE
jgi:hypothetical protein